MPRNYLIGSKVTEFRPADGSAPIPLHAYVNTVQDAIKPRLAVHEYLKVDGAEVEFMGNAPNIYRFSLVFVGSNGAIDTPGSDTSSAGNWIVEYRNLAARIQRSPKGTLIHPAFGDIRVACQGIDGAAIDVNQATNSVTIPIAFIDDQVDTRFEPAGVPSVAVKVSDVTDAISQVNEYTAPFTTAATAVATLVSSAATYAAAAQAASDDGAEDPSLETQLEAIGDQTQEAVSQIEADPANAAPADAYQAVSACEVLYAACVEVDQALRDSKPPLIQYTVRSDLNILALASLLYGPDASARVDEILQLNPGINAFLIPSGTVLELSTPTLV